MAKMIVYVTIAFCYRATRDDGGTDDDMKPYLSTSAPLGHRVPYGCSLFIGGKCGCQDYIHANCVAGQPGLIHSACSNWVLSVHVLQQVAIGPGSGRGQPRSPAAYPAFPLVSQLAT